MAFCKVIAHELQQTFLDLVFFLSEINNKRFGYIGAYGARVAFSHVFVHFLLIRQLGLSLQIVIDSWSVLLLVLANLWQMVIVHALRDAKHYLFLADGL